MAVSVRRLATPADDARASALFQSVWTGSTLMPPNLVRAIDHAGGYAYGAFDGEELVGASVAFLGGEPHDVYLYSHITGVTVRSRGVGYALKQHQRAWSLDRGIGRVVWTFDPLVRRNAAFNVARLGALPVRYLVDFYGPMDDGINRGDETDRLLVEWRLDAPPPAGGAEVHVAVPDDIEALRTTDPDRARQWRYEVRAALAPLLDAGWQVVGFSESGYGLRPPTS